MGQAKQNTSNVIVNRITPHGSKSSHQSYSIQGHLIWGALATRRFLIIAIVHDNCSGRMYGNLILSNGRSKP